MLIPMDAMQYFDAAIYYPLLLVVLERDRAAVEVGTLKFKEPYLKMIERAEKSINVDIQKTNAYFRQHKMKLNKLGNDGHFTEYEFIYGGYSENRRYMNLRLRNRTEELLEEYLMKEVDVSAQ